MSDKIPKRYILAVLAHFGFFVCYALRVNLSVAIVSMVNHTYANVEKSALRECTDGNETLQTHLQVYFILKKVYSFNKQQCVKNPRLLETAYPKSL